MKLFSWIKSNWKYFIKYAIVGVGGTIIDIGGFAALLRFTSITRFPAATISFIAAVINNYTWNKVWTFHDHQKAIGKQFVVFFLVSIVGLGLNLFFLWFFGYLIAEFLQSTPENLSVALNSLAKLGASGMVLTYNFFANRYITFKPE